MLRQLASHPLWQVGFRPFFSLACLAGLSLPALWILMFSGQLPVNMTAFSPIQWHAHEMFFGFGWAVIGGFLLTASKNWVQIRGYHGLALMYLSAAWIIERLGMACASQLPHSVFLLSNYLFLGSIVAMLVWTLVRHRKTDSYRDNYFFIVGLPLFLVAKYCLLSENHFQLGISMATGLFRLAFLVMLERTLSQFMKSAFQVELWRNPRLDGAIKLLGLLMVFEQLLPRNIAVIPALLLACLLALRMTGWKPHLALRRIDIGIMYLGYFSIIAQLVALSLETWGQVSWVGSIHTHLFTFGVMGLIIPAMLIRISKGHTGRKVSFDLGDRAVLWLMLLAFISRIIAPQLAAQHYLAWLTLAAACWAACFATLAIRYIPYLLQPRADGKTH
jgi:uncharacterized protein involved in response to NO